MLLKAQRVAAFRSEEETRDWGKMPRRKLKSEKYFPRRKNSIYSAKVLERMMYSVNQNVLA